MDGRGSVVPKALELSSIGKGPRSAYYYTILHLVLHIYRANPCPVPGRAKGLQSLFLIPIFAQANGALLIHGGAPRSTVEKKILGPSSFSTGRAPLSLRASLDKCSSHDSEERLFSRVDKAPLATLEIFEPFSRDL
ncbi:hypothetical protein YC2023_045182 [Brassica napus]